MKDESHSEPKIPLTPICQKSTECKKGKSAPIEMVHLKRKEKKESSRIEKKNVFVLFNSICNTKVPPGLAQAHRGTSGKPVAEQSLYLGSFHGWWWWGGGGGSHKSKHEPRGETQRLPLSASDITEGGRFSSLELLTPW